MARKKKLVKKVVKKAIAAVLKPEEVGYKTIDYNESLALTEKGFHLAEVRDNEPGVRERVYVFKESEKKIKGDK